MGFGETVAVEGPGSDALTERLRSLKQACSRTIQTSGANRFVRGAHHRRCAREGLTEPIMPYFWLKAQMANTMVVLKFEICREFAAGVGFDYAAGVGLITPQAWA